MHTKTAVRWVKRHQQSIDQWIAAHPNYNGPTDWDSMPMDLVRTLERINDYESLWSDGQRYFDDALFKTRQNNPRWAQDQAVQRDLPTFGQRVADLRSFGFPEPSNPDLVDGVNEFLSRFFRGRAPIARYGKGPGPGLVTLITSKAVPTVEGLLALAPQIAEELWKFLEHNRDQIAKTDRDVLDPWNYALGYYDKVVLVRDGRTLSFTARRPPLFSFPLPDPHPDDVKKAMLAYFKLRHMSNSEIRGKVQGDTIQLTFVVHLDLTDPERLDRTGKTIAQNLTGAIAEAQQQYAKDKLNPLLQFEKVTSPGKGLLVFHRAKGGFKRAHNGLRQQIQRIAALHPETRVHLVPLLRKYAEDGSVVA